MAAISGTAGSVVYVTGGTTLVAGIREWSIDLSHSPVETTAFGQNWTTYVPSIRNASGSFSGNLEYDDTAQRALINSMLGGSVVALRFYTAGTSYYQIGTAYLTGQNFSLSVDGKGESSFDFQSSGPVVLVGA